VTTLAEAVLAPAEMAKSATDREPVVLIAAFSARHALQQLLDDLFTALSTRIDCRVLVPTHYRGEIPEASVLRVPCGTTKIGGVIASLNPAAHWATIAALRQLRPDVVHILTGEGYLWAVTLATATRLTGRKLAITLHDPDPHPGNLFERLNAWVRRPVLAAAQVIHLFSSRHLERATALAPRARFETIAHGSLAWRFLRHHRPDIAREPLVLFFGRLESYKGIDVLCRAMARMPSCVRLAIAGPGALGEAEKLLVAELRDRVEVHNSYLDEAAVALLMQRASVVALPYRHVTQSSVPAIATSFGCPVVATALGHFVEEIPRLGGTLVPPEDAGALAEALTATLAAPRVASQPPLTFDELAPRFLELYRSVAVSTHSFSRASEEGERT
jgi:glycosyltransferase involved in cell wall biosynthesis